jgi:small nuclear ribonucleoprotein (snRNP)-like protein
MKIKAEAGKVYTLKLNSGEELIAKLTAVDEQFLLVENPVSVAPGPQGMGLVPSLFTADHANDVTINMNSVAMVAETEDGVRMKYLEATTGIKVPEKKIIMG